MSLQALPAQASHTSAHAPLLSAGNACRCAATTCNVVTMKGECIQCLCCSLMEFNRLLGLATNIGRAQR
jgi:hypothetical protein